MLGCHQFLEKCYLLCGDPHAQLAVINIEMVASEHLQFDIQNLLYRTPD